MRWERLFDDLSAQWDAATREQRLAEVVDRTRRELATVSLLARLAAHSGELDLLVLGGGRLAGTVLDLGSDFLVLADGPIQRLVPMAAVVQVGGLGRRSAAASEVTAARRFGLGYALRGIARDRAAVLLDDVAGRRLTGTIGVVGADHLDFAEHPLDMAPRAEAVRAVHTVPFAAVVAVSSTGASF